MTAPEDDALARPDEVATGRALSPRMSLEVAILSGEAADSGVGPPVAPGDRCILVVSPNADLRRYVGQCLRQRRGTAVLEAPAAAAALAMLPSVAIHLIVADEGEAGPLLGLAAPGTLVIGDGAAHASAALPGAVGCITPPFSAASLLAAVDRVL
jgi:hypothetical protein